MHTSIVAALAPLVVAVNAYAEAPASARDPRTAEVEAAFQALQTAAAARDRPTLERLVDPDFVMHHGYGRAEGRELWLNMAERGDFARRGSNAPQEFAARVRLFGDTAVRSWIVRLPRPYYDTWVRGTAVFVKRGGTWRAVSQQGTLLYEGPRAQAAAPLSAYAGIYHAEDREPFTVEAQDGWLRMIYDGGADLPLVPVGGDRFASGHGAWVAFERDADGRAAVMSRGSTADGRVWFRATRER